jgi:hypothetical protein
LLPKIASAFALGTTIIAVLGWVVSRFAGKIVVLSLFVTKRGD